MWGWCVRATKPASPRRFCQLLERTSYLALIEIFVGCSGESPAICLPIGDPQLVANEQIADG